MTNTPNVQMVPLEDVQPGPAIRSAPHTEEYLGMLIRAVDDLPPVVLQAGTYRLIDGAARIEATRRYGRTTIPAKLAAIPDEELYAARVERNARHGQPLTLLDKHVIAEELLSRHPTWSNGKIHAIVGLSRRTIGRIRDRATPAGAAAAHRIGLDGRLHHMGDEPPEHQQVRDLLSGDEEISLREIERRTGVPLTTVRRIRKRLEADRQRVESEAGPDTPETADERPNAVEPTQACDAAATPGGAEAAAPQATPGGRPSLRVWVGAIARRIATLIARIRLPRWWRVRQQEAPSPSTRHAKTEEAP